ncbi:MAG: hypothetical protein DVB23_002643 [Verrucomicrobia bacterium]|jgi:hypothetical protein|nr:MAG: hypothetical protein DVB23_002643 [Verrucomicrobiota bacterium]
MVGEVVVDDAAVIGVERGEFGWLPGVEDAFGDAVCLFEELVLVHGAVVVDVHTDAGSGGIASLEEAIDEILDVVDAIAILSDEEIAFGCKDVKARFVA